MSERVLTVRNTDFRIRLRDLAMAVSLVAGFLVLGAGCGGPTGYQEIPGPLPDGTLQIKGKTVQVEIALDAESRTRGLMFRKPEELPRDSGMLFFSSDSRRQSFFMKNTLIPLSIAFLDDEGKILQIEDMQPHDLSQTTSKESCRWALEMHQGWFDDNGIAKGDVFDDFRSSIEKTVGSSL